MRVLDNATRVSGKPGTFIVHQIVTIYIKLKQFLTIAHDVVVGHQNWMLHCYHVGQNTSFMLSFAVTLVVVWLVDQAHKNTCNIQFSEMQPELLDIAGRNRILSIYIASSPELVHFQSWRMDGAFHTHLLMAVMQSTPS